MNTTTCAVHGPYTSTGECTPCLRAQITALELLLDQSKKNTEDAIAVIKQANANTDAAIALTVKAQETAEKALRLAKA